MSQILKNRPNKEALLRFSGLAILTLFIVLFFQNCGSGMEAKDASSVGSSGTPSPAPAPAPAPAPTPMPVCPRTTNPLPSITSLSSTAVSFNLGMGRDAGTEANKSITVNYSSGDNFSGVVDIDVDDNGTNDNINLNINANAPNSPTASGSSNITIGAGNNAECMSGTVTVQVTVDDVIVNAQNAPINLCTALNRTSAPQSFTVNVSNTCLPTQRLNPSTPYDAGQTGRTVAIDNDWALAVSPGDEERGIDAGAAYVYRRTGTTWAQTQKLIPSSLTANSLLTGGAISGNLIALGAPLMNGGSGHVWIFQYNGTSWVEVASVPPPTAGALFGSALAISGTTVAVGAPRANNGGGLYSGAVYLLTGAGWNSITTLNPSGTTVARGEFGTSLAMSGSMLAVGAPFPNAVTAREEAVYMFNNGTLVNKISHTAGAADRFGFSVSLDGSNLLVGAPYHTNERGLAYLFQNTNVTASSANTRTYVLADPNGDDIDHFGYAVAIKGTRVLVGAPDKAEAAPKFGAVYLYATGANTQLFKIRSRLGDRSADSFGYSIGVSADGWLMSGALNDEHVLGTNNSGSVYFVDLP